MAATNFEPMSIGQILDRTFKIYKSNFIRFIAIVAIIHVPIGLFQIVSQSIVVSAFTSDAPPETAGTDITDITDKNATLYSNGIEKTEYSTTYPAEQSEFNSTMVVGSVCGAIIAIFVIIIGTVLCQGALTKSVSEFYLGNNISVGQAYKSVAPKIITLICAGLLIMLAVMFGFFLLVVPGIIFILWFQLTTPAIITENTSAIKGMGRSRALAKGNLGKIFSVVFLVGIISAIAGYIIAIPFSVASAVFKNSFTIPMVIKMIGQISGNIITAPIGAAALILLYYDLRIRKEGFDLEMLAQSIGNEQTEVNN